MSDPPELRSRRREEARRWRVFADEDLQAAKTLISQRPPLLRGAAFHCQQAAEKMAKAVLVSVGAEVPKIHDISELSWLVRDHIPELGDEIGSLGSLTNWAISARYPDVEAGLAPNDEDVRQVLVRLNQLRSRIENLASKAQ